MGLSRAFTWLTIQFYTFPPSFLLNNEKRWGFGVAAAKQPEISSPNNESLRHYRELIHPVNSVQSEPSTGLKWIPAEPMNLTRYQQRVSNNRGKPLAFLRDKSQCVLSAAFAAHALSIRNKTLWLFLIIAMENERTLISTGQKIIFYSFM